MEDYSSFCSDKNEAENLDFEDDLEAILILFDQGNKNLKIKHLITLLIFH